MYRIYAFLPFLLAGSLFGDEADSMPMPRDQGFFQTLVMLGIAALFFYFILWRPEQKRRNEMESLRNKMKKGDKVTAMGILGTIYKVQEQTVILKMVDGSKIEVLKGAITDLVPGVDEDTVKE